MQYKIAAIGDVHWGALDPDKQLQEFMLFLKFLEEVDIDLVVINGDYFDYKLPLNSRSAIYAIQCMQKIIDLSWGEDREEKFKIRIVRGTKSHDEDQLNVFQPVDEDDHLKIFNSLTVEETLTDLEILYGPDENINTDEYYLKYIRTLCRPNFPNMGFFHGNFDILTNSLAVEAIKNNNLPTVMFEYDRLKRLIDGPIISSHQHRHCIVDQLYNIGSYSRWEFDQEELKGFAFIVYDTDTHKYLYKQIENPFTPNYDTYEFRTSHFKSTSEMTELVNLIKQKIADEPKTYIRIKIIVDDESEDKAAFVSGIKDHFLNIRRVKVHITNAKKKKQVEIENKETQDRINKFGYLTARMNEIEKIKRFLHEEHNIDVPDDILNKYVSKYLNK